MADEEFLQYVSNRPMLPEHVKARLEQTDKPTVLEWYSLCTDDCEHGYHVPVFKKCDRCNSQIHRTVVEVFDPERGEITVGSECIKNILGWKWGRSHETALVIQTILDKVLVEVGTPIAILRKRDAGRMLIQTAESAYPYDGTKSDSPEPSGEGWKMRRGQVLMTTPGGWTSNLLRAAADLGLPWRAVEKDDLEGDGRKKAWFGSGPGWIVGVRGTSLTDDMGKQGWRVRNYTKIIASGQLPDDVPGWAASRAALERGRPEAQNDHVEVLTTIGPWVRYRFDHNYWSGYDAEEYRGMNERKENPVRKRKTDDKRFGEEISITDYFHAGSPKAMEALGGESEDVSCVRCGAKISHVFMTQYGPMGGDCIATLTGDDSTRKAIRTLLENLKRSKMIVEGEGQGRLTSLEIEVDSYDRRDIVFRTEAYWFDRARYASRTVAVVKSSPAAVAAAAEWAEGNNLPVKMKGPFPWEKKQNPCPCSKNQRRNPTRPDWPVEQCVGCGKDVVLKRPRAGEVLCSSCLKTKRDTQRKLAAQRQQQSRQEDERINRQVQSCLRCKGFGCSVCDPRLAAAARKNPSGMTWKDYIRGEWWIDEYGESLFADVDIGEAGHEIIAIDSMLDKEILADGVIKHYKAKLRKTKGADKKWVRDKIKDQIAETERYRNNDEMNASQIYLSQEIPEEAGIAAAGSKEAWEDLVRDARMAYAKHKGAILAVNRDFAAWQVTSKTIEGIQGFILEQSGGEEIEDKSTEMCVEEHETQRTVCMPVMEFLTLKHPRDLWALLGPEVNPAMRPLLAPKGKLFVLFSDSSATRFYVSAQVGEARSGKWMVAVNVGDQEILNLGATESAKGAVASLRQAAHVLEQMLPQDRWDPPSRALLRQWKGAKRNPVRDRKLSTYRGWSASPKEKDGDLVVVKQGRFYFVAHRSGLQLGAPWSDKNYAKDKLRFYAKEPSGVTLVTRALARDRKALQDVAEDLSFNNWMYGRRLERQKKTRTP